MRLLVVNPNTTASVSETLRRHVAAVAGPEASLRVATARFGAAYISDETSFAIAAHAALDAVAVDLDRHGDADAVLCGCFGDPGIDALRQLTGRPVVGLAEAAMRAAAAHGRFAIVTGGLAWKPMLERLARSLGHGESLVRVEVVTATGAQLAADPERAHAVLAEACRRAAIGVDAVILGGAGLAGMAAAIAPALDVALIDSVAAGAQALVEAARVPSTSAGPTAASPDPARWSGLGDPLSRRLR